MQIEGAATNISVGYDGTVWCVNKTHEIYRLDRSSNKWSIVPGELVQVSLISFTSLFLAPCLY
jgi:hypothetical protein